MNHIYLLSDSVIKYFRECYVRELNAEKYNKFVQSLNDKQSILVEETKESLRLTLQNADDVEFVSTLSSEVITNEIAEQLVELLSKEQFKFVNQQIRSKFPISIPFVIATAMVKGATIVVDKNSQEWMRYDKICASNNITYIGLPEYISSL